MRYTYTHFGSLKVALVGCGGTVSCWLCSKLPGFWSSSSVGRACRFQTSTTKASASGNQTASTQTQMRKSTGATLTTAQGRRRGIRGDTTDKQGNSATGQVLDFDFKQPTVCNLAGAPAPPLRGHCSCSGAHEREHTSSLVVSPRRQMSRCRSGHTTAPSQVPGKDLRRSSRAVAK